VRPRVLCPAGFEGLIGSRVEPRIQDCGTLEAERMLALPLSSRYGEDG